MDEQNRDRNTDMDRDRPGGQGGPERDPGSQREPGSQGPDTEMRLPGANESGSPEGADEDADTGTQTTPEMQTNRR